MKNVNNDIPTENIYGRNLYSTIFTDEYDIGGKNVVDIGCGYGWFELFLLKNKPKSVIGLDVTESDIGTAKSNIKSRYIKFETGDVLNLKYKNNSFDTAFAWEVLEHVTKEHELEMFKEVYRVLKSGGVFYLSTPCSNWIAKILDPAWWLMGHRHYSVGRVLEYSLSVGFKCEKLVIKGRYWELLGMLDLYISKWIFRRKPFFEKYINTKQNLEFEKKHGFTNIFIKLSK